MFELNRFKNLHKGATCVIIGNGPSLNQTDPSRVKYTTFGSNKIYRYPFTPTYYCMIDEFMARNCLPLPKDFAPKEMFIRAEAGVGCPIYPIVVDGFSVDIANFIVMGGTVTYALMQIAFYMGFKTMLLIGVDHHYPKYDIGGGRTFKAEGEDPSHFKTQDGKPYFEEGGIFAAPELKGTTRSYSIAKQLFDQAGVRCVNLTPGTHLDVFEKGKFEDWL